MGRGALTGEEILDLWERTGPSAGLGAIERALALAGFDGTDPDILAREPVGRANAGLLRLRLALSGPRMPALSDCPGCAGRVEFELDALALLAAQDAPPPAGGALSADGVHVHWRAPSSADLLDLTATPDPVRALLESCVHAQATGGARIAVTDVPADLIAAVEGAMAAADPLSEVVVALICPYCAADFDCDVDLAGFVWAELDARASGLLHEVDVLARAYGWTEPEVLALSAARRGAYLRMALGEGP